VPTTFNKYSFPMVRSAKTYILKARIKVSKALLLEVGSMVSSKWPKN
jgi:hypothetical protein